MASLGQRLGNQPSQHLFINDPGHPKAMHQLASLNDTISHPLIEADAHRSIASLNTVRSGVVASSSGLDDTLGLEVGLDVEGTLARNR
jgi:hypothetical protein